MCRYNTSVDFCEPSGVKERPQQCKRTRVGLDLLQKHYQRDRKMQVSIVCLGCIPYSLAWLSPVVNSQTELLPKVTL